MRQACRKSIRGAHPRSQNSLAVFATCTTRILLALKAGAPLSTDPTMTPLPETSQTIANLQAALDRAHERVRDNAATIARLNASLGDATAKVGQLERQLLALRTDLRQRAEQ